MQKIRFFFVSDVNHAIPPELWLSAAKWEFEENSNPDCARGLLQRALRFNPDARNLWIEVQTLNDCIFVQLKKWHLVLQFKKIENAKLIC